MMQNQVLSIKSQSTPLSKLRNTLTFLLGETMKTLGYSRQLRKMTMIQSLKVLLRKIRLEGLIDSTNTIIVDEYNFMGYLILRKTQKSSSYVMSSMQMSVTASRLVLKNTMMNISSMPMGILVITHVLKRACMGNLN